MGFVEGIESLILVGNENDSEVGKMKKEPVKFKRKLVMEVLWLEYVINACTIT